MPPGLLSISRVVNVAEQRARTGHDQVTELHRKSPAKRAQRRTVPSNIQRMRDFLAAHPSDGGHGRYTWSDTDLDAGEVRERVRTYQLRYDIPTEQLR